MKITIMTIYVDDELISWKGKEWCHMVADTLPELHQFAVKLGLKASWFQNESKYPHYDVTVNMRDKALRMGAKLGDRSTMISCAKELKTQLYTNNHSCQNSFSQLNLWGEDSHHGCTKERKNNTRS
ncbi:DUF4031 domain-containing protein [Methylobacillus caricis]|uniref:DUF4031 domain-containing protein n=1 Tax=Methylobacillus caricis TaxID=1971611 RepID=UPI001CFFECFD|nr:DUF4031 domain-containing protein [Methylobacillus caricis]MCB5188871.1 DUF4031 domain-containing protein [Methylobacillus caricis]